MSYILIIVYVFVIMVKSMEFILQESELFMVTEAPFLDYPMDLGLYHFTFAIQDLDPTIGRVKVEYVKDPADGEKEYQELEMIDCR